MNPYIVLDPCTPLPKIARKTAVGAFRLAAALAILVGITQISNAANYTWSGLSGTDFFWETPGNWSSGGPPGLKDTALVFETGSTNNNTNATIIVTNNITVNALRFGQTNVNTGQNMVINPGVTLTISGTNDNGYGRLGSDPSQSTLGTITNGLDTFFVGPWPGPGGTVALNLTNTISGSGTVVVNNTNNELEVRYGSGTNVKHYSVLDMSGLNTFTANLSRLGVAFGRAGNETVRAMGILLLATNNTITLSGPTTNDYENLVVASNSGNNDGNSTTALLYLGETNRINANGILIGSQKTPGTAGFNTNFASLSPSLVLRGADGVSRVARLRLGDESDAGSTSSGTTGILDLSLGTADMLVDTLILGKGQNGPNNVTTAGTLLIGGGKLDVNSLELGYQFTSAAGATSAANGTGTFSNTTVTVNTLLQMGRSAGSAGARNATLNINGGSMTVNGTYLNQGTVTINITNAPLTLPGGAAVNAKTIILDGATLANAGYLGATNALNIYNNGAIFGSPVLDLGNTGANPSWDLQAISGGTLNVSNALEGTGTVLGNVSLASAAAISPGEIGQVGTLSIGGTSGNLTLNNGGTLNMDLSTSGSGVNDLISAGGTVTVNGTVNVFLKSIGGTLDTTTPYTLITSGTLAGNQSQFQVVGPLTTGRYTFAFDTTTVPNTVRLVVGGSGPANQRWVGDGLANVWDAQDAPNWNNGSGSSQFFNLDNVTFTDSGSATPPVNVTGSLVPGSMTVSNSVENYVLAGNGSLSVAGPVTKAGTGSLTFDNTNANTFSSVVAVTNGTVTFANNGLNAFQSGIDLIGGSLVFAGNSTNVIFNPNTGAPVIMIGAGTTLSVNNANANTFNASLIQLDGTLAFNQPVAALLDSSLEDAGTLTVTNTGPLLLAGNNSSFSGLIQINGGTVKAANANSPLGAGSVVITNTGALDLNSESFTIPAVTVSGAGPGGTGALVNTGSPVPNNYTTTAGGFISVTLAGNTSIGGSGPYNTSDPVNNPGYLVLTGTLSTSGNAYNLTKVGLNEISLFNLTVDSGLGNIDVQQGLLMLEDSTTGLGNISSNLTVRAGATLGFYDTTTPWLKNFVLFGDGSTANFYVKSAITANTVAGPVALNGNCVINGTLTLDGPLGGSGDLTEIGSGTLTLEATNTYTGTTAVNSGTMLVEGILGTNTVTVSGGSLGGIGIINGAVTIASGGALSPGDTANTFGVLTISNSLTLSGTYSNNVQKSGGVFTSGIVTNITTLTLGGTLQLALTGDPLAAGDVIPLFSFGTAHAAFASISPPTPGDGLAWDTSALTTAGVLKVSIAPPPAPGIASFTRSGNTLVLNITNGAANGSNYVLASTNLALPLLQWAPVATNPFDASGNSSWTNTIDPTVPRQFYVIQLAP